MVTTTAGQKRWQVYYQNYQSDKNACKPKLEKNSVSEGIKQKAITFGVSLPFIAFVFGITAEKSPRAKRALAVG
ncbi:hypothetical protein [Pleurocapsa sp. PCC 7319]|uniref:hypothetical protein n=1 Tax=Pleurocapsa sp. PCC 7319 TaxID=118161 RepID=UPI00034DA7E8|nr:hypothetical protein [Pleurocapsa sp. PCC 7319]